MLVILILMVMKMPRQATAVLEAIPPPPTWLVMGRRPQGIKGLLVLDLDDDYEDDDQTITTNINS